eukprot:jgi/Ulvmu1/10016/UM059_0065.1
MFSASTKRNLLHRLAAPLHARIVLTHPRSAVTRSAAAAPDQSDARTTSRLVRPCEFCTTPLKVRAFEIDQYGVVNNAVYVQYLQHARHELLEAEDLEHHPEIPAYALSELKMKYLRPLRSTQSYVITVSVKALKQARAILNQRVILLHENGEAEDQVVVEGEVTVVLLDTDYRPMRLPDFFTEKFTAYMDVLR